MILTKTFIKAAPCLLLALLLFCMPASCFAKAGGAVKFSIQRKENIRSKKETLVLPFAFPSDSMGTTAGIGAMAKGFGQKQLLLAGAGWASTDDAVGGVLAFWDLLIPSTDRLFFSAMGSIGKYPRQRAYTNLPRLEGGAGSNSSSQDDYIQEEGDDNWFESKIEYVLPIGEMKTKSMASYNLEEGLLQSGASGGGDWNPLDSGVSVFVVRQYNRYQSYKTAQGEVEGTIHPIEFGLLYNNTDFPPNPSVGSSQYLSYTRDFGWGESIDKWSFISFESSKYFDLGTSRTAKQQVLALNFWTGFSPSWKTTDNDDGTVSISDDPPYITGANLGGFYRLRAYPSHRFNDKAVIYSTAEYRHTLRWNPATNISWLKLFKLDWFQLVGFVEGGRVASDYTFSELLADWKTDAGVGLRMMVAGGVVRFDYTISSEASSAWVMFGHPF